MIQFVKRSREETETKSHKPSLDAHKTRVPRNERVRIILVRLRFQEVRLEFRLRGAPTRIWNASVVGLAFDSLPSRFSGATLSYTDVVEHPYVKTELLSNERLDRFEPNVLLVANHATSPTILPQTRRTYGREKMKSKRRPLKRWCRKF